MAAKQNLLSPTQSLADYSLRFVLLPCSAVLAYKQQAVFWYGEGSHYACKAGLF